MSTLESTDLRNQQNGSFYFLSDVSFIFEIPALDVTETLTLDPSFESVIDIDGLNDVDATAILEIAASDISGLFIFESDSIDLDDVGLADISFGCDPTFQFNFNYSESVLSHGHINISLESNVKQDYVRHIAKRVTGGYNLADIFKNETDLVNATAALDASFDILFTQITAAGSTTTTPSSGSVQEACRSLITNILNTESGRREVFLADIAAQTSGTNLGSSEHQRFLFQFHVGDVIAVRILYKPKDSNPIGNNIITDRSYKIFLKVTSE
jgi:hypothetical protein